MVKQPVKYRIIYYFSLFFLSVLFLLIYSSATSPLTNYYGMDSASFIVVAKGMTQGMLPYRDFFDMKGPYFYLIEYLGQLICPGRTGAFIIQCINLTIILSIIDRIYRYNNVFYSRSSHVIRILTLFPCLYIASFTFEYGNLTEEFSLPLLLWALYCAIRYLSIISAGKNNEGHPFKYGVYYGAAFGILALIRITNAALIGAIILTISVELLVHKKYKNLLYNALAFIIGTAAAFVPMCIYYAMHGLLKEMLYSVFLFGVKYSTETSFLNKFVFLLSRRIPYIAFMTLPIIVPAIMKKSVWEFRLLSICAFSFTLIASSMGFGYTHYFTLGIPLVALGMYYLLNMIHSAEELKQIFSNKKLRWSIILIAAVQIPYFAYFSILNTYHIADSENAKEQVEQIKEITGKIPEDDKVFVYGFDSCSAFYAKADRMPPTKYFDWQPHYLSLVPEIGGELKEELNSGEIQWLISPEYFLDLPISINETIKENYEIQVQCEGYNLYHYSTR